MNRAITARDRRSIVSNEGAFQLVAAGNAGGRSGATEGAGAGSATTLSPPGYGVPRRVEALFMTRPKRI